MEYRKLITKAWELTKKHTYLSWIAVVPLALQLILVTVSLPFRLSLYLDDQLFYKIYDFLGNKFYEYQSGAVILILGVLILFILYLIVPAFCDGALIASVAKIVYRGEEKIKKQFTIAYGLNVYLPLVELRAVTSLFNPLILILPMSLILQYQPELFKLILIPVICFFIIDLIVVFSLVYSKYELVINRTGVLESIKKSLKLVFFNLTEILFVLVLLLLIVIRAVINFLIVFFIPILIYGLTTLLLSFLHVYLLYALVVLGSLFAYYYVLRIAANLNVFITFVMVLSYLTLSEKASDVIIKDKEKPIALEDDNKKEELNVNQINSSDPKIAKDMLETIGKSLLKEMERITAERNKEEQNILENQNRKVLPDQTLQANNDKEDSNNNSMTS